METDKLTWQLALTVSLGIETHRALIGTLLINSGAVAPPSSRGLGRHPFKVEIRGSNPLGGTTVMSRDIGDTWVSRSPETSAIGRGLFAGCASTSGRLDAVAGQDIAGVESDDRHLALVDDRQDSPSGVGGADLEMVQPAGAAEGDPAIAIGHVVAEPEVPRGPCPGGLGLGVARYASAGVIRPIARWGRCSLWSRRNASSPTCSSPRSGRPADTRQPALQGLVEALDLALGLGMTGRPFFWRTPR